MCIAALLTGLPCLTDWDETAFPQLEQLILYNNIFKSGLPLSWAVTRKQLRVLLLHQNDIVGSLPPGQ